MSKQSEARKKQNYNAKPDRDMCSNCKYFNSDMVPSEWNPEYIQEKNLRCGIGEFAVKKTATCSDHKFKA